MLTLFMKLIVEKGSGVIQKQPLPLITSFLVAVLFSREDLLFSLPTNRLSYFGERAVEIAKTWWHLLIVKCF